jgi:hypothetical protein
MPATKACKHSPAWVALTALAAVLIGSAPGPRGVLPQSSARADEGGEFRAGYEAIPGRPSILVQQKAEGWKRLVPGGRVQADEPLVSLPGYASSIRLPGVRLLLSGNIPAFSRDSIMDLLLESAVVLRANPNFDADLTVLRGRVVLTATKPGARVRLRFHKQLWDLTLTAADTEVGIDLMRQFPPEANWREGEAPQTLLFLCVLQGKASLKVKEDVIHELEAPPGAALVSWDNKGGPPAAPLRVEKAPPIWSKDSPIAEWKRERQEIQQKIEKLPADKARELKAYHDSLGGRIKSAEAMTSALEPLSKSITDSQSVSAALVEGSRPAHDLAHRLLSIYALSALDEVVPLLGVLAREKEDAGPDRDAAVYAMRRWLSRDAEQGKLLYRDDRRPRTGLLLSKPNTPKEAELILTLLHDFPSGEAGTKELFELLVHYLASDNLAIRELAGWHLVRLSQGMSKIPPFDAAWPADQRAASVAEWQKLLDKNLLPPKAPPK